MIRDWRQHQPSRSSSLGVERLDPYRRWSGRLSLESFLTLQFKNPLG